MEMTRFQPDTAKGENTMKITWLGKACFALEKDGYTLLIDPYHNAGTGYPVLKAQAHEILVSHESNGHGWRKAVTLLPPGAASPFTVETVETYHDTLQGSQRGPMTIHVITDNEGVRVVHTGDMGTWTEDDLLRDADVLMVESGSYRTMMSEELGQWACQMEPRIIIPMHYHHDRVLSRRVFTLEDLLYYIDPSYPVEYYDGNTMEVGKDTPRQVAVLKDIV